MAEVSAWSGSTPTTLAVFQGLFGKSSGHSRAPSLTFVRRGLQVEQRDLTFVIPTYRLRDVGETVEQYDQHFWRNGHSVRIMVFDDSSDDS
jgi:hypothetical protein